jgi:hypothetical protein
MAECDGFSHRGELSGVAEWSRVVESPQLPRDETHVSGKEAGRARRLILVKRFGDRICRTIGHGMPLEIGVSRQHDDPIGQNTRRKPQTAQ